MTVLDLGLDEFIVGVDILLLLLLLLLLPLVNWTVLLMKQSASGTKVKRDQTFS